MIFKIKPTNLPPIKGRRRNFKPEVNAPLSLYSDELYVKKNLQPIFIVHLTVKFPVMPIIVCDRPYHTSCFALVMCST